VGQMSKKPELRLRFFYAALRPGRFFCSQKTMSGMWFWISLIPPFSRFSALLLCFFRFSFFFRPSTFPLMNRQLFGKRRKPFLKLQADFVR